MNNVELVKAALLKFQKDLQARKSKTVTGALLTSYDTVVTLFTTEFATPIPPPVVVPPPVVTPVPIVVIPVPTDPSPYPTPQGNTVFVTAGSDLQAAYDAAAPGTTLMVDPDANYRPIQFKSKATNAPIAIRPKLDLPLGRLNTKALPFKLPRIVHDSADFVNTAPGAHDVIMTGFEMFAPPGQPIISVGTSYETKLEEQPDNIWFDRIWIHCDELKGGHRGIAVNGRKTVVLRSVIEGFWQEGRDSQAIGGWSGLGPTWIEDCFLSASGEVVLFGGGTPSVPGVHPSGLVLRRSHLFKPLEWKLKRGATKNLFELKNMRGALIEENIMENCWVDAQDGHGLLLTVRTDANWADGTISDIVIRYNVIKNIEGYAFDLLGQNDLYPSIKAKNCDIHDNLVVGSYRGGFLIQRGWTNLKIRHNTILGNTYQLMSLGANMDAANKPLPTDLLEGFAFTDNVVQSGTYGIVGPGMAPGTPSYTPFVTADAVFARNVIEQAPSNWPYPANNAVIAAGTLLTQLQADKSVRTGSTADVPSTDGKAVGADIAALKAKMAGLGVTW